eukprot:TRINITY_DN45047_c0_g1_i1.p1 TRINITY_DN45047_c0_g1~~TRINITY_DN45047_c0_g1_i1.p1  ORF type:complete len:595 (-),score=87.37 TRINITY_DN45047_c0_g1_i1:22-1806(-)
MQQLLCALFWFTFSLPLTEQQGNPYNNCCLGKEAPTDLDGILEQGGKGDSSVLPQIFKIIAAGGMDCSGTVGEPSLSCEGTTDGLSKGAWTKYFEAQALSKYMRLQPYPEGADPEMLWKTCCNGSDADNVLREMEKDCALGTVALMLSNVVGIEDAHGTVAARKTFLHSQAIRQRHWALQGQDCRWASQVNHGPFQHFAWFLDAVPTRQRFPCQADVRIFVDERSDLQGLRAKPLHCARRGLCFTEVWIHQYLLYSDCRVSNREEADIVYYPVYGACYGLDQPGPEHKVELERLYKSVDSSAGARSKTQKNLILMTCEKWKMEGWQRNMREHAVVAAVESKPLIDVVPSEEVPTGRKYTQHCADCFDHNRDLVIPSAVLPGDALRLQFFNREPKDRTLTLCFHGEHANSRSRDDVAEGYREVNETVRLSILATLDGKPDTSVGGHSMRYSFIMGNSHFCLIPRGRGWWTVRLFEAFYAGCVPVLLSDDYDVPFGDFLDWSKFSLKWPMQQADDRLYQHLRYLLDERRELVDSLHAGVREVACWFNFLAPESADCSPYLGLMRTLALRTPRAASGRHGRPPAPAGGGHHATSFWF